MKKQNEPAILIDECVLRSAYQKDSIYHNMCRNTLNRNQLFYVDSNVPRSVIWKAREASGNKEIHSYIFGGRTDLSMEFDDVYATYRTINHNILDMINADMKRKIKECNDDKSASKYMSDLATLLKPLTDKFFVERPDKKDIHLLTTAGFLRKKYDQVFVLSTDYHVVLCRSVPEGYRDVVPRTIKRYIGVDCGWPYEFYDDTFSQASADESVVREVGKEELIDLKEKVDKDAKAY